jgi:hypothetical protein
MGGQGCFGFGFGVETDGEQELFKGLIGVV